MKLWQNFITSLSLLPLGSKSDPPLPPPIGRVVRAVLKDLLECQELQDAEVDRWVQTQATLVRADGAVHLDTETAIDLNLTLIVQPGHPEHDDPLWLDESLQYLPRSILRVSIHYQAQRLSHLLDGLVELRFARVPFS